MSTELAVLEVAEKNYPKIYCVGGLDAFYQKAKAEVEGEVPDLSTGVGRDRVASLAAGISRSKTAVVKPGRAYNKFLKAQPKLIDIELREFIEKMDQLRDKTREPLTAWEAEKAAAEAKELAEKLAKEEAEALAKEIELLEREAIIEYSEREYAEKLAEQERIDLAEEIKRQAAYDARIQAEQEAAEKIAQANRDRIEAEQREAKAKQDIIDAQAKADQAERDRVAAEAKAKQDAIDAKERLILAGQQSIRNAEVAAENARQAELKRQQDEAARVATAKAAREADKRHANGVKTKAMNDFIDAGLNRDDARLAVKALAAGKIRGQELKY